MAGRAVSDAWQVMSTVQQTAPAMPRNSAQALLRALASMPLEAISEAIHKDDSVACRVRSGDARLTVQELGALIDACGQKLVSKDAVCIRREKYESMSHLFAAAMSDEATVRRLIWDEEKAG